MCIAESPLAARAPSRRLKSRLPRQQRFSLRGVLPFMGPAFIAAIAYIDPGNFATNIQAGAQYGYLLLWVILASNLMAILLQTLSAKLGIATGKNLPQLCREYLPRPVSVGLWVVAEIGAMATDLAEFLGAAIGFNLLFHMPLLLAGVRDRRRHLRHPRRWSGSGSARWRPSSPSCWGSSPSAT